MTAVLSLFLLCHRSLKQQALLGQILDLHNTGAEAEKSYLTNFFCWTARQSDLRQKCLGFEVEEQEFRSVTAADHSE